MKKVYPIILILALGGMLFNSYSIHFKPKKNKVVYVDINEVFNSFIFKQEMERKLVSETRNSSKYLDSLAFEIQAMAQSSREVSQPSENEDLEALKSLYYQKRSYYENFTVELTQNYDNQVLTQMKQYLQDFGKENEFDYVLGKSEDGLVLYGTEIQDVTQNAIVFINDKYQG